MVSVQNHRAVLVWAGKGHSYAPKPDPPECLLISSGALLPSWDTPAFVNPLKAWQKFLPMSCSLARPTHSCTGVALKRDHSGKKLPSISAGAELHFTLAPSGRGEPIGNEILDLESISLWR